MGFNSVFKGLIVSIPDEKALLTIAAQDAVAKFHTPKYHTVSQLVAGRTTVGFVSLVTLSCKMNRPKFYL